MSRSTQPTGSLPSTQPTSPPSGPSNPFHPFPPEELEQSVPDRFARQVREHATRVAVKAGGLELTYQHLDAAAGRLARALLARPGPDGGPVALLLGHGAGPVVAMLGALQAGKVFVPLDPSFPLPRLALMLEHAQVGMLVTDTANLPLATQLGGGRCPVLNLDAPGPDRTDPRPGLLPDSPACILYTSGSTGRPKGVVHSHRSLLHFALLHTNALHLCPEDRMALLASTAFAASLADILPTLLTGATLLPFDLKAQGMQALARWLRDEQLTIYHSVPTLFRHFAATLTAGETFPHLRAVCLGGEPVRARDVELFAQHFGGDCLLAVSFSATETGTLRQFWLRGPGDLTAGRVPVGYGFDNVETEVVGEDGAAVAPGQAGEVLVRSPYLALGYWREPEETRKAFPPDPRRPGWRCYRTGDLAVLHPDGCMEHLGRKDDQVKIRGHRIEVAEIEAAMLQQGSLKEVAVVVREGPTGEPRLAAFCVPAVRPAPDASELRRGLRERLPAFMIPAAVTLVDTLPLTATGKVDRRALSEAPPSPSADPGGDRVQPRDPLQFGLMKIWQRLLQAGGLLKGTDNFFDLGGDSLLAVKMLAEVEQTYGKNLSLATLFGDLTIDALTAAILHEGERPASALVRIQAGAPSRLPFFFLHGDVGGAGLYCLPLARHLPPDQPFYALHPHGIFSNSVPLTIEEMAADHVRTLCAFRPQGPYLLGGHCNGAVVAFEMAQLLRARGREVRLLALAEPPAVSELARERPRASGPMPPLGLEGVKLADRYGPLLETFRQAFSWYFPRPYHGKTTLFLLQGAQEKRGDPSLGWGALAAGGGKIVFVPGQHHALVVTHLAVFADLLGKQLELAQRGEPAPAANKQQ